MKPSSPNPFIVIWDKWGDAYDVLSGNCTTDLVYALIRCADEESPDDAPHSAWKWYGSQFLPFKDTV